MVNFYHKEVIEKMKDLRKELVILRELNIKPNYAELARKYNCDYRTVKKYNEGYEGKSSIRLKKSHLDKYKDEITEKLNLPGSNITATYQYLKVKYSDIGSYSNFGYYIRKRNLLEKNKKIVPHPRYETDYGIQLQFDWKESITMSNKHGEVFQFNIFSAILSSSRFHTFVYSKTKTKEDVKRCLVKTFKHIQGIPEEILTDNMSTIVNTSTKKFLPDFIAFSKDMGVKCKKCKPRKACTKGKVESQNRFMSWLIPYNNEFETEEELIKIIDNIEKKVNQEINDTTGCTPLFLYEKEKEYLKPLPNKELLNRYEIDFKSIKVPNTFLVLYKGNQYSVPMQYINKTVKLREIDNKLHIYYNNNLIACHAISNQKINYKPEHYIEGMNYWLKNWSEEEINNIVKSNLKQLQKLN